MLKKPILLVAVVALLFALAPAAQADIAQYVDFIDDASALLNLSGRDVLAAVNFYDPDRIANGARTVGVIQGVDFDDFRTNVDDTGLPITLLAGVGGTLSTVISYSEGREFNGAPGSGGTNETQIGSFTPVTPDNTEAERLANSGACYTRHTASDLTFAFGAGWANTVVEVQMLGGGVWNKEPEDPYMGILTASVDSVDLGYVEDQGYNMQLSTFETTTDPNGDLLIDLTLTGDRDAILAGMTVTAGGATPTYTWVGASDAWNTVNWDDGTSTVAPGIDGDMTIDVAGATVNVDADFKFGSPGMAASVTVGNVSGTNDSTLVIDSPFELGVTGLVDINTGATLTVNGTLTAAAGTVAGTLAGSGTITADALDSSGTIAPGPGIATLNVEGDVELADEGTLAVQIDGTTHDQLAVKTTANNMFLSGNLTIEVLGVGNVDPGDPTNNLGENTYPIVQVVGEAEGVIEDTFTNTPKIHVLADWGYPDEAPDPMDASPAVDGHLGDGVFFQGLENTLDAGSVIAVNAKLFIARGGDGNADTKVDGADISQLVARFNSDASYPRNRSWFDMDTAGDPTTGRSDGYVDGADISGLVAGWTGDPGPAEEGTAVSSRGNAEYNPATGEFTVSVENVMSWTLRSDGKFTGAADVLPLGDATNLVSANLNTVGEGGFGEAMSYRDVLLGALTEPGTDASEFSIEYVTGYGQPIQRGSVSVIPEPGTAVMLAGGLLGLLLLWRRRRQA